MDGIRQRSVVMALASALVLVAARPALADNGTALVANGVVGGILMGVNVGLGIATACDEGRPVPNRGLAWSAVGFGLAGIVSGAITIAAGASTFNDTPGRDDTVEFQHQMSGLFMTPGIISVIDGIFALGIGLHDALRPGHPAPPLPHPVVLGDRRTGPLPGLAWSTRF
jgi:hypothetical protein